MNRRYLCSAALIGAMTALSVGQASAAGTQSTLEGTYRAIAAEPKTGSQHDHQVVVDKHGRSTPVRLTRKLTPGTKVRLTGKRTAGTFEASSVQVVAAAPKTTAPTPTATAPTGTGAAVQLATTAATRQRVLVILASWTTPDSVTKEAAEKLFLGDADAWFTQASHGAMGLTGDVTPWLTVAGPDQNLCWANMYQLMTQAKEAAKSRGFDAATYDRTVLYFPPAPAGSDCANYAGWATVPGSEVWLNGNLSLRTAIHEQGHNLGLGHAFAWSCRNPDGSAATLSSTCSVSEYGDPIDAMGGSSYVGFFAAPQMLRRGWLAPERLTDLSAGGSATLQPLESSSGTVAAKVTVGTRTYWMEYRTGAGMDAGVPVGSRGGVLIRMGDGTRPEAGLLDVTPADGFDASALKTSWVSPEGVKISVGTDGGAGLPVTVTQAAVPTVPVSLGLSLKAGGMTVRWAAPASDGGAPVTGYVIEVGSTRATVSAATLTWASGPLASGTYTPRVWATNVVGAGPAVSGVITKR